MAKARKSGTDARSESPETSEGALSEEVTSEITKAEDASESIADVETEPVATEEIETETASDEIHEPEPDLESADAGAAVHETLPEPDGIENQQQPAVAVAERPRRGGFVPMALGGAVAAGLGFGAATYVLPDLLSPKTPSEEMAAFNERLEVQDGRAAELQQEIATLKSDLADKVGSSALAEQTGTLDASLTDLHGAIEQIDGRLSEQTQKLDDFQSRLAELEKRPVEGGAASASALEAFGREMEEMRGEIALQRTAAEEAKKEIDAAAAAATERMAAIAEEATRLREEADETAKTAAASAALSRLRSALDNGGALDAALADLEAAGVEIPPVLAEQSQGVPTIAALREAYPPAARDALAASLKETAEGSTLDRLGAFLRSQSGARSLSPRAGDDPDAVLSRAEAALKAGDLAMAVSEIEALPPDGQARMAEWVTLASRRIDAMQAVTQVTSAME